MRCGNALGRQEELQSLGVGTPFSALSRVARRSRAARAREWNGFDRGDIRQVSDQQLKVLRETTILDCHPHGRAAFATLSMRASIFFSRGLSLTAVLRMVRSRRGVSR
jgi:hypothetical protein